MKNWLTPEKFRELNAGWLAQGGGHPDAVVDDVVALLNEELHYEALIGKFQDRFLATQSQEYHHLAGWLTEMVCHLLYFRHQKNADRILENARWYEGFAKFAQRHSQLWVFSLNHDVCVEIVCDRFSVPWSNGFHDTTVDFCLQNHGSAERLSFDRINVADLNETGMRFPDSAIVRLVKLHGGIDIFSHNDNKEIVALPAAPGGTERIAALAKLYEQSSYHIDGHRAKATNEFIVSDDAGEMQFLRNTLLSGHHKFSKQLTQNAPRELLTLFDISIASFGSVTAIGYGFGDGHINDILVAWMRADRSRRLIIVDPYRKAIPAALDGLDDQVELRQVAATEYLDTLGSIARSREENLKLELGRLVRGMRNNEERTCLFHQACRAHLEAVIPKMATRIQELDARAAEPTQQEVENEARAIIGNTEDFLEFVIDYIRKHRSS
ncbi:hypothetical protein [Sorangium sp. So ce1024]|uniref:hypothetical protein n=1 Tax=Sorangium sp. So ce1024 TaxID=3133327 RepID=UPI003EFD69AB